MQVLGPLAAWRFGQAVELGAPKQRAVLAVLALRANGLVHREAIIDAVWGQEPPATAVNLVQSYASRLRRALDPGRSPASGGGLLVTAGSGYWLRLGTAQLDLLSFELLVGRARAAASAGDAGAACALYEQALELWRGEPLADVDCLRGHPAVIDLGRRWAAATAEYAEAAIGVGLGERVLGHLRALAGREPLNERAHALLMLALAGSGQQAAALHLYDDLRRRLDDQLGVRPGPELADAHVRVLRQQVPAAGRHALQAAPVPVVPRQLPAGVRHFAGRIDELKALSRLLDQAGQPGGAVVISAIGGTAGVGKSALAVHWGHQVADRFPDGQLYVNLRGFDPSAAPMPSHEAIRGFLDALAAPAERIPASLHAQVGLYRSMLADRRTLVVLDNARDEQQVRPLLTASSTCLVVVTSRNQLAGLITTEGAHALTLDLLSEADAQELLSRGLGAEAVAAEPEAVAELIGLCARLPLALSVVAARAAIHPGTPLGALAADLRSARGRLDALDTGEAASSVRAVFSWSYQNLAQPTARLFRLLSRHAGPDITAPATASLAAIPQEQAHQQLRKLARAHLLSEHTPGRFAFHDLLRTYAAEQANAHDPDDVRRAATQRMLDHYLHTAYAADRLVQTTRDAITLAPLHPGVAPEELADRAQALAWLEAERRVLLAAVTQAARARFDVHAWQLPWSLVTFFDRWGYWHDLAAIHQTALAAARRLADLNGQARTHVAIATASARLGSHEDADTNLRYALDLQRRLRDRAGQARVHLALAQVCGRQHHYSEALAHAQQALDLYRAVGHRAGQADALNSAGFTLSHLGDHQRALTHCQEAVDLHRAVGNRHGEALTWDSVGYARHQLGHHPQAVACFRQALTLYRQLGGDRYRQTVVLTHLGDTHQAAGRPPAAREAWRQALAILDDLHHPDAGLVRAKLAGLDAEHERP
jgi:DNA-binding SARP family transcriptional activator